MTPSSKEGSDNGSNGKDMPNSNDSCVLARDVHVRLASHDARFLAHEVLDDTRMRTFSELLERIERQLESSQAVMKDEIKESIDAVKNEAKESNKALMTSVEKAHAAIHASIAEINKKVLGVLSLMVLGLFSSLCAVIVWIWLNRNLFPPGP